MNCVHCGRPIAGRQPTQPALLQQELPITGLIGPPQERPPPPTPWRHPRSPPTTPRSGRRRTAPNNSGKPMAGTPQLSGARSTAWRRRSTAGPPANRSTHRGPCTNTPARPHAAGRRSTHELGLLDNDTTPPVRAWIDRRSGELPTGFAGRSVPGCWYCSPGTPEPGPAPTPPSMSISAPSRRSSAMGDPPISPPRGHPRRPRTVLEPLRGHQLRNALAALRSLFRFAKKHGDAFANPTTRLRLDLSTPACYRWPPPRSAPSKRPPSTRRCD